MKRKRLGIGVILVLLVSLAIVRSTADSDDRTKASSIYALDTEQLKPVLPAVYDYREAGRAPEVKNQGDLGTCWAFASLTALESAVSPDDRVNLSVDHMSLQNGFHLNQEDGGDYTMSMAYLLSWQGPVPEQDDPYGDGLSPEGLEPVAHVQEIQILPEKNYEAIKTAVYLRGGVQSSLYTSVTGHESRLAYYNEDTNAYFYTGTKAPNHDVVIVGWDDYYPKENFNMTPKADGAFLCVSSWGTEFGEDGYFYVSYEDSSIGTHNILYAGVENTDNYDHIYQSDLCGWVGQLGYGKDSAYAANVYQAGGHEVIEAVGFYATGERTEYEVYLSRHIGEQPDFVDREPVAAGQFLYSGYYTIKLDKPAELELGERFGVIVKITTPGTVRPIAIEYQAEDLAGTADLGDGEGYISYDGTVWEPTEKNYHCNLCIKAYTADCGGAS